jgi:hypothetical protein
MIPNSYLPPPVPEAAPVGGVPLGGVPQPSDVSAPGGPAGHSQWLQSLQHFLSGGAQGGGQWGNLFGSRGHFGVNPAGGARAGRSAWMPSGGVAAAPSAAYTGGAPVSTEGGGYSALLNYLKGESGIAANPTSTVSYSNNTRGY